MASILQVEELRGPTSGANANKVIIPSGQTLDVSAAGLIPAGGQIVNYEIIENSSFALNYTSTFADLWAFNYTPVLSSSNVYVVWQLFLHAWRSGSDGRITVRTKVDNVENRYLYKFGLYDYGGGGPWYKLPLLFNSVDDNTDGATKTHLIQAKTDGAEGIEMNNSGSTAYASSFAYIYEVAK
jgi:hypothetical protein